MKGNTMFPLSIRAALLAGIAAAAMTVPAAASPAISGKTDAHPVKANVVQYAQDFRHGSGAVDYGYKSKKCKKSDKACQAKAKKKNDTKG